MKKMLFLFFAFWAMMIVRGQAPQAIKYQAVARNAAGEVMANQAVSFRISVLSGSANGTAVYSETHSGKRTNAFGLVDLEIGKGIVATGSFAAIPWESNTFFLRVEMDPAGGSAYTPMGTSPLLSVPYALHAKTVEVDLVDDADADAANEIQLLQLAGNQLSLSKNGGMVTLPDADANNEIQALSVSGTLLTLSKGGGSVTLPSSGGGDNWGTQSVVADATLAGQGTTAQPLMVADNGITSLKILDGTIANGDLADNAVTSQKITNGTVTAADLADHAVTTQKLQDLSVSSVKIQTGAVYSGNLANMAVISDKIANDAVTGEKIARAGAASGQVLKYNGTTWAPGNDEAGSLWEKSDNGIFYNGGYVGIGTTQPSAKLTVAGTLSSSSMKIVNSISGYGVSDGLDISQYGTNSYLSNMENGPLYLSTNGLIRTTLSSEGNLGIGTMAPLRKLDVNGEVNISGNGEYMLYSKGAETIWYDGTYFSWGYGGNYNYFSDNVTIGGGGSMVPNYKLVVNGDAAKTLGGSWSVVSDARLKDLKGEYLKGLDEILRLKPVKFTYKPGNPRGLDSGEEQIGFVAQEVQEVFPEAVKEGRDGYLDFNMHSVHVAMVNAVKALKAENDQLKEQNAVLTGEQSALKARLDEEVEERMVLKGRLEKIESLLQIRASAAMEFVK